MRLPGPLWRRTALRLAGEGTTALLVVSSFTLLATAAATRAPFGEAASNAALASVLAAVPPNTPPSQGPGLRVAGGSPSAAGLEQQKLLARVAAIPGLTPPVLSGISVAAETADPLRPVVTSVVAGRRRELARLAGVQDAARLLVPVGAVPAPAAEQGGPPRVWLGEPTARALAVRPGDSVVLELRRGASQEVQKVTIAGLYAVAEDGRRPADPDGTSFWVSRRADLPRNTTLSRLPSPLVVADVPIAQGVARALGDRLLWSIDAALDPRTDTLAGVAGAAAGIDELGLTVRDPDSGTQTTGPLTASVASGLPGIVRSARIAADATQARTDSLSRAAVALAAVVVLAAAALTLARRRTELVLGGTLGIGPARLAGLAALEHLPAAVLGGALGLAASWAVLATAGPPGRLTAASAGPAVTDVVTAMLLALAGVAVLTGATAAVAARPRRGTSRRRLPWELLLGVAAATATAGLVTTEDSGRPEGALALLVPLLLVAGIAAVGSRLVVLGLARLLGGRRPAAVAGRGRARGAGRRVARGLALRRLASPGGARAAVIAVLATGTGLLAFGLAAAGSTRTTIEDRVAIAAGAQATATIPAAWQLDPGAAVQPPPDPEEPFEDPDPKPVPGVRNPPLAAGRTVTWRTKIGDPTAYGSLDLLVVDPAGFDTAAMWGRGPRLAEARRLLTQLRDADRTAFRTLDQGGSAAVPVLAVGHPTFAVGEQVSIRPGDDSVRVQVVGTVDAFPSLTPLPLLVAPADSLFRSIVREDPRVVPPSGFGRPQAFPLVTLWSAGGAADARAVLAGVDLDDVAVATADTRRQQPELQAAVAALGYQQALGWAAALVALIAFAVHADRTAAAGRLTDLFLVRVGLGARGVRRARTLELLAMGAVAVVLALASVQLLRPVGARLLDPQRSATPPFELTVGPGVLAVAAGSVLVSVAVAALAGAARARRGTPEEVLRDA